MRISVNRCIYEIWKPFCLGHFNSKVQEQPAADVSSTPDAAQGVQALIRIKSAGVNFADRPRHATW